jgi:hypothetical protein
VTAGTWRLPFCSGLKPFELSPETELALLIALAEHTLDGYLDIMSEDDVCPEDEGRLR